MIVCHCNVITKADIELAVRDLLSDDPWYQLTPGAVYHALGKRGKCCGCFPAVIDHLIAVVQELRHEDCAERIKWVDNTLNQLRLLNERRTSVEKLKQLKGRTHDERRRKGHRAA